MNERQKLCNDALDRAKAALNLLRNKCQAAADDVAHYEADLRAAVRFDPQSWNLTPGVQRRCSNCGAETGEVAVQLSHKDLVYCSRCGLSLLASMVEG